VNSFNFLHIYRDFGKAYNFYLIPSE